MVVGFNHNFSYKGVVYHIQTEDGGRNSPNIVTLLYRGGTILASRKTSYADITRIDNLAQVVEELMKEQHKGMLRSLKNGEFDDAISRFETGGAQGKPVAAPTAQLPLPPVPEVVSPAPRPPAPPQVAVSPVMAEAASPAPVPPAVMPSAGNPSASKKPASAGEASLDEIILSYLLGEEK